MWPPASISQYPFSLTSQYLNTHLCQYLNISIFQHFNLCQHLNISISTCFNIYLCQYINISIPTVPSLPPVALWRCCPLWTRVRDYIQVLTADASVFIIFSSSFLNKQRCKEESATHTQRITDQLFLQKNRIPQPPSQIYFVKDLYAHLKSLTLYLYLYICNFVYLSSLM